MSMDFFTMYCEEIRQKNNALFFRSNAAALFVNYIVIVKGEITQFFNFNQNMNIELFPFAYHAINV